MKSLEDEMKQLVEETAHKMPEALAATGAGKSFLAEALKPLQEADSLAGPVHGGPFLRKSKEPEGT